MRRLPPWVGSSSTSKTAQAVAARAPLRPRAGRSRRSARGRWCRTRVRSTHAQQVRHLDRDARRSARGATPSPAHEVVEVGNVREHVVGDDQVGGRAPRDEVARRVSTPKNAHLGRDARRLGDLGHVGRRLDTEHRDARGDEVLQQVAVVARDLDDEALRPEAEPRRSAPLGEPPGVLDPGVGVRREVGVVGEDLLGRHDVVDLHQPARRAEAGAQRIPLLLASRCRARDRSSRGAGHRGRARRARGASRTNDTPACLTSPSCPFSIGAPAGTGACGEIASVSAQRSQSTVQRTASSTLTTGRHPSTERARAASRVRTGASTPGPPAGSQVPPPHAAIARAAISTTRSASLASGPKLSARGSDSARRAASRSA